MPAKKSQKSSFVSFIVHEAYKIYGECIISPLECHSEFSSIPLSNHKDVCCIMMTNYYNELYYL